MNKIKNINQCHLERLRSRRRDLSKFQLDNISPLCVRDDVIYDKISYNSERGSMFFYIMLGVVLFATLAFTVSRGMRGSQTDAMSDRKAELAAAEILDYAQKISHAVDKLRRKGCSESDISFEDNGGVSKKRDDTPWDYTNLNSPADFSCHVFHQNGGKVRAKLIPGSYAVDPGSVPISWMHPQSFIITPSRIKGNGTDVGAAGTDLILWVGRLTNQVCMKINDKLGISNPSNAPPVDSWDCNGNVFQGVFAACANPMGDTITQLDGKSSFCVALDNSGRENIFIQLLIAR